MSQRTVVVFAAFLTLASAAFASDEPASRVTGKFSRGGQEIAITDVSAHRMPVDDATDPAWELVFSERPHEHSAAGREAALAGEHGLAFTVEVLEDGEGHSFVLYAREPGATSAYPSSSPWPAVSGFSVHDGDVKGRVANNADFPFQGLVFDLAFETVLTP
jgi:hypothetical protein